MAVIRILTPHAVIVSLFRHSVNTASGVCECSACVVVSGQKNLKVLLEFRCCTCGCIVVRGAKGIAGLHT